MIIPNLRRVFLASTLAVAALALATLSATAAVTDEGYVKDGLLLYFDGINNTGSGHDNGATVWKDLSGNGSDASAVDGVTAPAWCAFGVDFADENVRYALKFAASEALAAKAGQSLTLEFIATDGGAPWRDGIRMFVLNPTVAARSTGFNSSAMAMTTWRGIFFANETGGSGWGGDFRLGIGRGMAIQGGYATVLTTNNEFSITAVLDTENTKYIGYYRGQKCGEVAYDFALPTTVTEGWIGTDDYNYRGFKGCIHAIRLYDHILTAEEIAANHAVDKARYFDAIAMIYTEGSPARYGSPVPAYGTDMATVGSVQNFAITNSIVRYDDGRDAVPVDSLSRAVLTNCVVSTCEGGTVLHQGVDTSFDLTVSSALNVTWGFAVEHALSVTAVGSGTISVNGGEAVSSAVNWGDDGRIVTLRATAGSGHEFEGWSGDVSGVADTKAEQITVTVAESRSVVATFSPANYTSSSYAQSGLVLQFDGIDNDIVDNVRCHTANPSLWKDLTGYGSDAGASDTGSAMPPWTDFGPVWSNQTDKLQLMFTASQQVKNLTNCNWTLEVVATDLGMEENQINGGIFSLMPSNGKTGESTIVPLACCWWRNIFFMNGCGGQGWGCHIPLALNTNCQGGYAGDNYCVDREMAVAYTCPADYSRADGYYQGRYIGGATIKESGRPNLEIEWGYVGTDNSSRSTSRAGFKGRLHAIRLYNRILTDAELAFNHKVDRKRYLNGIVRVEGYPSQHGTPSPGYEICNFTPDSSQHFSIAGSLVEFPDGEMAVDEGLTRAVVTNCVIGAGGTILHSGAATDFDCTITTNCQATWMFDVQHALAVLSPAQGTIAVNEGASSLCVTNWGADGRTVRVVATPANGYKFVAWTGDTDGIADTTSADVTFTVSSERTLAATFAEAQHEPTTCTWKDGVTSGSWSDNANWANGAAPNAGDTVNVPSAATITLDVPTAELAALNLGDGASLVVSKWSTAIRATAVTVGTGATIRAAGPFLDGEMSNRVWIVGNTLNVQSGGAICADGAGYAGTNGLAWAGVPTTVYSIYNSNNTNPFGGSYGGEQGYRWPENMVQRGERNGYVETYPATYGSAEWPFDPGSGGGAFASAGGGAICLDFSGTVTVDGRVSADAAPEFGWVSWKQAPQGSGGGIVVRCRKIVGDGVVSASSIATESTLESHLAGGGGGGRIAIHYATDAQTTDDCRVRFLARGGLYRRTSEDQFSRYGGGCGTLWFTDNRLLAAMGEDCPFSGTWMSGVALDEVSFPGRTVFTNGCFRLVDKTVAFGGDILLDGASNAAYSPFGLELQDCETTVAGSVDVIGAQLAVKGGKFTVAGDLRQKNRVGTTIATSRGGDFLAAASPTNGTDGAVGALVTVGGTWSMESNAVAYVKCDPTNGAAVAFHVGFFVEAEGAMVDARAYGWRHGFYNSSGRYESACGPAPAALGAAGAGHIGLGGGNKAPTYAAYDDSEHPVCPGSGGVACSGGGVISIVADRDMRIAGSLCADGYNPTLDNAYAAGSAGGTVYLHCRHLIGFSTAKVSASANLASGGSYGGDYGSGGGGAIALWSVKSRAPDWTEASGVLNASANYSGSGATVAPQGGTIHWGYFSPGFVLLVR